ncbi:UPF0658 Golgi apparatus membrane protein [Colletotrichum aenigma]|uniref:UPF0658 Golgi apparatus membrane protein n=1 Tax=Colletotrichum aenigma TaxID=1215731 RepID=UPI0018723357|nr:UPF0658 Golgi apparatus membrane protein [Colletotrichum aenigma]KAF5518792.1 UPF0658 Golgi apparatus membrane protein [Colletotrichum aenigma]
MECEDMGLTRSRPHAFRHTHPPPTLLLRLAPPAVVSIALHDDSLDRPAVSSSPFPIDDPLPPHKNHLTLDSFRGVANTVDLATRLDSRRSLLGGDPNFAGYDQELAAQQYAQQYQQQYQQQYNPPQASYNQGYAFREGLAPSTMNGSHPASGNQGFMGFGFMGAKWPRIFFGITLVQAIICLAFEAYVFWKFQTSLTDDAPTGNAKEDSPRKTIPTFLTLFIFGFLYELVIVWDALRAKNTIQVIGVCIANLALMVYTAIQVDQIAEAVDELKRINALINPNDDMWADVKPYLVAIPCILAFGTITMGFVAWKLYQVFAWDILKTIGADYRMKKRFLHYQIYIALLKFDFFFFLGFTVQFLVIVNARTDAEFGLTIAAIPVTIAILLMAAWFTRIENKIGMICVLVLYFGALSYFIFKLVRIYQPATRDQYQPVRKSLTAFTVITILLIICTIVNCVVCMRNFNAGLKTHLRKPSKDLEKNPDLNSINLQDVKPSVASRMTID